MNSVKLNKKHLFSIFITLVLLFSLNLNVFASSSHNVNLFDCDFTAYYFSDNVDATDCTSKVTKSEVTSTIDSVEYHTTKFTFSSLYSAFNKQIMLNPKLNMYTKTDYKYRFYVRCGEVANCDCVVNATILFSNGSTSSYIELAPNTTFKSNSWLECSGSLTTPDISGNVTATLIFAIGQEKSSGTVGNTFYATDIELTVDSPLYGEAIETPSNDDLSDSLQNYDDLMGSLPSVDSAVINDLMNFDFGSFIDGMNFVRDMFDRTLMAFNFNSVLLFSLVFGLACLILGRKAGN